MVVADIATTIQSVPIACRTQWSKRSDLRYNPRATGVSVRYEQSRIAIWSATYEA
jgi:hypothetical protein